MEAISLQCGAFLKLGSSRYQEMQCNASLAFGPTEKKQLVGSRAEAALSRSERQSVILVPRQAQHRHLEVSSRAGRQRSHSRQIDHCVGASQSSAVVDICIAIATRRGSHGSHPVDFKTAEYHGGRALAGQLRFVSNCARAQRPIVQA